MSWKATAWAKTTRGHRSHGCGRLLFVLSDYHDTERDIAWPSQTTLSQDCEMPKRTVQWCLATLERQGFITTVQKGNQYQPTQYRLNLSVLLAPAQLGEPARSEPASIAPASEPARLEGVKAQDEASEGAKPVGTSLQEPPIEPPSDNPRWVEIFETDQRWKRPLNGYIQDVEASYRALDLTMEANNCLHWLETNPTGKRRKTIIGTWNNWLKRALKEIRSPPSSAAPPRGASRSEPRRNREEYPEEF